MKVAALFGLLALLVACGSGGEPPLPEEPEVQQPAAVEEPVAPPSLLVPDGGCEVDGIVYTAEGSVVGCRDGRADCAALPSNPSACGVVVPPAPVEAPAKPSAPKKVSPKKEESSVKVVAVPSAPSAATRAAGIPSGKYCYKDASRYVELVVEGTDATGEIWTSSSGPASASFVAKVEGDGLRFLQEDGSRGRRTVDRMVRASRHMIELGRSTLTTTACR